MKKNYGIYKKTAKKMLFSSFFYKFFKKFEVKQGIIGNKYI